MKSTDQGYAIANSPMRTDGGLQLTGPMTMRQLSERLTRVTGRPVLDATGLDGYFVIDLSFAPEEPATSNGSGPTAPRLTSAVQDQLGLKLAGSKEPVKLSNFSDEGCRIEMNGDFRMGERLQIAIPRMGQVKAQVRWALPGSAGAKFLAEADF